MTLDWRHVSNKGHNNRDLNRPTVTVTWHASQYTSYLESSKGTSLVEFMYFVFSRPPGEGYRRRSRSLLLCLLLCVWCLPLLTSEGRTVMSDVSPPSGIAGLSFDSTLLSPRLFFCLVLLLFLSYFFLPAGPLLWTFFFFFSRKFFNIFHLGDRLFCMAPV